MSSKGFRRFNWHRWFIEFLHFHSSRQALGTSGEIRRHCWNDRQINCALYLLPKILRLLINRRRVAGEMITFMAFNAGNQKWLFVVRVTSEGDAYSTLDAEPLVAGADEVHEVYWNFWLAAVVGARRMKMTASTSVALRQFLGQVQRILQLSAEASDTHSILPIRFNLKKKKWNVNKHRKFQANE